MFTFLYSCIHDIQLVPGGQAASVGVEVGDLIVGVAGFYVENYDDIMHQIQRNSRPVVIGFSRAPLETDTEEQDQASKTNVCIDRYTYMCLYVFKK